MQKIYTIFAFLAAFALISGVSAYTEEENVLVLGDKDLSSALEEFEYVLVEFYAPWCGHCKKLAPEYARAATILKEEASTVKLAKVDCTVEKESGERYQVKGYPTLKFFIKGEPIEYEGGRVEKEIVSWLKKKTQPSTSEVTSAEDLAKQINSNEVLVVLFGGQDSASYKAFDSVSKQYDDVTFVYTSNADLKKEQNVADDKHVLILKKFDEGRAELSGDVTVESLKTLIDDNRFPLVLPFDQKAAQKIFGEATPAVFLMHQKNEAGERAEAVFREAAQKLKGKIQFSISDFNDGGLGPRLAEFVGVKESDLPAIRIVVPQRQASPKKYLFDQDLTVDNLVKFYESFKDNKLSPFLKSEPVPESNDGPVKTVVGHNFKEVVEDSDANVLIEFYAPWCGHCKSLEPIWNQLGEEYANRKDIVIAKMDSTANEVESVNVSGFPTIKFYQRGNKRNPVNYDGDRNKEAFIAWLKEKAPAANAPEGEL